MAEEANAACNAFQAGVVAAVERWFINVVFEIRIDDNTVVQSNDHMCAITQDLFLVPFASRFVMSRIGRHHTVDRSVTLPWFYLCKAFVPIVQHLALHADA